MTFRTIAGLCAPVSRHAHSSVPSTPLRQALAVLGRPMAWGQVRLTPSGGCDEGRRRFTASRPLVLHALRFHRVARSAQGLLRPLRRAGLRLATDVRGAVHSSQPPRNGHGFRSAPALFAPVLHRICRPGALVLAAVAAALFAAPVDAWAASVFNGFPLVDDVLCGFFAYSRTKIAPMIAGIVLIFSVVGHWLGTGKMWSTMLYVGLGLGIVLGAGSVLASYTGVASSCISA